MTESSIRQEIAALLAIHASRGQAPHGKQPNAEELALLLEGRLESARKQEVYSHLNANHGLYRQWLLLVERGATATAPQTETSSPNKNKGISQNRHSRDSSEQRSGGDEKRVFRGAFKLPWLHWLGASGLLAGTAALLLIAPWRAEMPAPATQGEMAQEQKPQQLELPQTAGTQVILPDSTRAALRGMLGTLAEEHSEYRAQLAPLAGDSAKESGFYAFGAKLGLLHNACAGEGKVSEQLSADIRSQAQTMTWPSGPLSLTMARMGIEQDLCALAAELHEEILSIQVQQ